MSTTLLPFQPEAMTPAQLAAVSFLARYSGHTHAVYGYQLRRWFAWCETNHLDPAGRDPASARGAVHPAPGPPARHQCAARLLRPRDPVAHRAVPAGQREFSPAHAR